MNLVREQRASDYNFLSSSAVNFAGHNFSVQLKLQFEPPAHAQPPTMPPNRTFTGGSKADLQLLEFEDIRKAKDRAQEKEKKATDLTVVLTEVACAAIAEVKLQGQIVDLLIKNFEGTNKEPPPELAAMLKRANSKHRPTFKLHTYRTWC